MAELRVQQGKRLPLNPQTRSSYIDTAAISRHQTQPSSGVRISGHPGKKKKKLPAPREANRYGNKRGWPTRSCPTGRVFTKVELKLLSLNVWCQETETRVNVDQYTHLWGETDASISVFQLSS